MAKRKIRPYGEILLELEEKLDEMIDDHGVQAGDILNGVYGHLESHRPDCFEEYEDGGCPTFYYGPWEE